MHKANVIKSFIFEIDIDRKLTSSLKLKPNETKNEPYDVNTPYNDQYSNFKKLNEDNQDDSIKMVSSLDNARNGVSSSLTQNNKE